MTTAITSTRRNRRVLSTVWMVLAALPILANFVAQSTPLGATSTAEPTSSLGKLAFVQEGDIWVRELPTGEPRRLTVDGHNASPRWSPTGKWLAFRKEDEVWLAEVDGEASWTLNQVSEFAWSPVEDRIAFVTLSGDLRIISADGSRSLDLTATMRSIIASVSSDITINRVDWSPDGTWIAGSLIETLKPDPPVHAASLWRVRVDGTEAAIIHTTPRPSENGLILARWSPDGTNVLFWPDPLFSASVLAEGVPLYVIPAAGGTPRKIAPEMLPHPDFLAPSPRGNLIAIVAGAGRETWTNKQIKILNLITGRETTLTPDTATATSPAWSPDGLQIAFTTAPDIGSAGGGEAAKGGMAKRRIWVTNIDGINARPLTNEPEYRDEYPQWSADGRTILFTRLDVEGRASVWLVSSTGDNLRQVVEDLSPAPERFGDYGWIDWSKWVDWWRSPSFPQVVNPR